MAEERKGNSSSLTFFKPTKSEDVLDTNKAIDNIRSIVSRNCDIAFGDISNQDLNSIATIDDALKQLQSAFPESESASTRENSKVVVDNLEEQNFSSQLLYQVDEQNTPDYSTTSFIPSTSGTIYLDSSLDLPVSTSTNKLLFGMSTTTSDFSAPRKLSADELETTPPILAKSKTLTTSSNKELVTQAITVLLQELGLIREQQELINNAATKLFYETIWQKLNQMLSKIYNEVLERKQTKLPKGASKSLDWITVGAGFLPIPFLAAGITIFKKLINEGLQLYNEHKNSECKEQLKIINGENFPPVYIQLIAETVARKLSQLYSGWLNGAKDETQRKILADSAVMRLNHCLCHYSLNQGKLVDELPEAVEQLKGIGTDYICINNTGPYAYYSIDVIFSRPSPKKLKGFDKASIPSLVLQEDLKDLIQRLEKTEKQIEQLIKMMPIRNEASPQNEEVNAPKLQ